jgi:hypothetical protein
MDPALEGDETERPEMVLERAELRKKLAALIAALPVRYRVAVVLRHVQGFGYSEIATLLDQPIGSVFVAYNGLGISAVMRGASATKFEEAFRARFNRPIRQVAALPALLARMLWHQWSGRARPSPVSTCVASRSSSAPCC